MPRPRALAPRRARRFAPALALASFAACGAHGAFEHDSPAGRATCAWRVGATTLARPGNSVTALARE